MIFPLATLFYVYAPWRVGWVNAHYAEILKCYVKAVVAALNQEKALVLVGVFSVVKLQFLRRFV